MNVKSKIIATISVVAVLGMSGCADKQPGSSDAANQRIADLEKQISQKDATISKLKMSKSEAEAKNESLPNDVVDNSLVPPNAKPGQCYSKVLVPAKYEIKKVRKLVRQAGVKIDVIPAIYKKAKKVVTVSEESSRLVAIPATYKIVKEKVLVRPETKRLIAVEPTYKFEEQKVMVSPEKISYISIPETYRTVEEKILVRKAHTVWKKGRGSVEKVNNTTGDIMCLVEIPAVYKTITKKVIDTPARTKKITKPAVYKTITKKVIDTPATTKSIAIPEKTAVVYTKVLDTPAKEVKREIPAVYKDVQIRQKVSEPYLKWQEILCETNTTPNVVLKLQRALKAKSYNITKFDGIYGEETRRAVQAYQKDMGMARGALTLKTLKSLGVM